MGNFQDFSLIKIEVSNIEKEKKFTSKSYAFIFMVLEKIIFTEEIEDLITDGPNDFGIDAYYINEKKREINIFQFKYSEKFETAQKSIKEKNLDKMIVTLEAIWNKNNTFFSKANYKLKEAINEIDKSIERGFVNTRVFFVTNFLTPLPEEDKERYGQIFSKKFRAKLIVWGLDNLVDLILSYKREPRDTQLKFVGENYFDLAKGQIRALIGEVKATSLIKALLTQNDELDEGFFEENIRIYLQLKGKINRQIYETAKGNNRHKFFAYNNGITAICDSLEYTPATDPLVRLKNFQIVNGGQTIHALYDVYKDPNFREKLKDVSLLVRIYEVKDRNIGQEIARYTNTQNPVKMRDIMANDEIQIKLEEELKRYGYYYERKKNQYRDKVVSEKRVDAEKVGQTILAYYIEKPGYSKNRKQEIFGDFYKDIFDETKINAEYVLIPYLLYKNIEKEIKKLQKEIRKLEKENRDRDLKSKLKKEGFILHAHYYILFTIKLLLQKDKRKIKVKEVNEIFRRYFKKAVKILGQIIKEKETQPDFSIIKIFKSNDLVDDVKEAILL